MVDKAFAYFVIHDTYFKLWFNVQGGKMSIFRTFHDFEATFQVGTSRQAMVKQ